MTTARKPLNAFTSAAEFFHQLGIEDDSRLYPFADAIRSIPAPYYPLKAKAATKWDMRFCGLIDRNDMLTEIGKSIWNHLHS